MRRCTYDTRAPSPRVLDAVGDAAGARLVSTECTDACCSDAVQRCRSLSGCDTVEVRLPRPLNDTRMRTHQRRSEPPKPTAVLRSAYTAFGIHKAAGFKKRVVADLEEKVRRCKRLHERAREATPTVGVRSRATWLKPRLEWRQLYCDEYAAAAGRPLPDLGYTLTEALQRDLSHCPAAGAQFMVVTYQNGPSPWLCTFLRTLGYQGVPVTVLGWQPRAFSRSNNVFYFTDRVYTTLRYLRSCPTLSPNASFMFCDTDELLQLGLDELRARTEEIYSATAASVIISAEPTCMPRRLGKPAWFHAENSSYMMALKQKRLDELSGRKSRRRRDAAATALATRKWPRCLNTGNFVGRVAAVIDMLHRMCRPCSKEGLDIETVFRRYTRAYSAQVERWVYSEQAELMHAHLARPSNVSGWTLDFTQQLFHPCFWFNTNVDVRALRNGRLMNVHTGTTPAFVHYNGNSKSNWIGPVAPGSVAAALKRAYVARTGDARLARLESYLRDDVTFLGPTFVRDRTVSFADVCRAGEV